MNAKRLAALPLLALLLGMAKSPPKEKQPMEDPAKLIVSQRPDGPSAWKGGYSQSPGETALVRDADAWTALWKEKIGQPAPPVNFDEYVAVAVFLGSRNTGGYGVEFLPPEMDANAVVFGYREKKPAPGGFVMQAFTQPYAIQLYRKPSVPVEVRAR